MKYKEAQYGDFITFDRKPSEEEIKEAKETLAEQMKKVILEHAHFIYKTPGVLCKSRDPLSQMERKNYTIGLKIILFVEK